MPMIPTRAREKVQMCTRLRSQEIWSMNRRKAIRVCGTAIMILLVVALGHSVEGQSLHSVVEPRARVFPTVGPGVTALKRDSSRRYYILAKPATVVSIYGSDGN